MASRRVLAPVFKRLTFGKVAAFGLTLGGASFSTHYQELMHARKLIWLHTVDLANSTNGPVDAEVTKKSIASTKEYDTKQDGLWVKTKLGEKWQKVKVPSTGPLHETKIEVVDQDSFVAAKKLVDAGYKPLVLNMANKLSIGGGVEQGSPAQEECLFRASNYFQSLYPWGTRCTTGPRAGRMLYLEPIPEFGSYYSPLIQVFRDSSREYEIVPTFVVDCIAVAGHDLRTSVLKAKPTEQYQPDNNVRDLTGDDLIEAFVHGTKKKIRHAFDVALVEGNDSLVLGAISCGAFALEGKGEFMPVWVSDAMHDVLNEPDYRSRFRAVTFAVLSAGAAGKRNNEVFRAKFHT